MERLGHATRTYRRPDGVDADRAVPLRAGVLVRADEWDQLYVEGRLRTRAQAVAERSSSEIAVFSHTTAAALWSLPVFRLPSDRVHVTVPARTTRHDSRDVVRHQLALTEQEVEVRDDLRVTSLPRTVFDVIRTTPLEAGVCCFDAALRAVAWREREQTYDVEAAEAFRAGVVDRIRRSVGYRGVRRARYVADFADGRADFPGESVSRLWMHQLGVAAPDLQLRVGHDGGHSLLDFAWPSLRRWAEFDGQIKYTDPSLLRGRPAEEVRERQQRRERKIRASTGWRVDRWGFAELDSIGVFARHLHAIGLLGG